MSSSRSALANNAFVSVTKKRILPGWLPILVVAIVVFWLSGGLPPTAWRLLFEMLIHWHALQVEQGSATIFYFAVLLVQAVLILVAWIMLIIAIEREVMVFKRLQSQQRVMALQATLAAPVPEKDIAQPSVSDQTHGVVASADEAKSQGAQLSSDWQNADDDGRNPFDDDTLDTIPEWPMRPKSQGIQIDPSQIDHDDEEDGKVQDGLDDSSEDDSEELDNPFDMSQAIFELSPEEEESEEEEQEEEEEEKSEQKPIFVFGNPFEGDLPEIFDYDMDLRRELEDMQARIPKGQAVGEKDKEEQETEAQGKDEEARGDKEEQDKERQDTE
jgi:hypothetical protein